MLSMKPEVRWHILQRVALLLFLLFLFVLITHDTTTGPCQSMPSRKQSSASNFVKFVLSVMCKLLFRPNASHYQLQPENCV